MHRVTFACLVACGSTPSRPPVPPSSTVAGFWSVGQLAHAESELSIYELGGDGRVEHIASWDTALHTGDRPIGTVAHGDTTCTFGDRWRDLSGGRVAIEGACTDRTPRTIELRLTTAPASRFWTAEIVAVGGERGWSHPGRDWQFRRCTDRADCMRELTEMTR